MFKKADKSMSLPRIFIIGKTGSGKSASMLRILHGMQAFYRDKESEHEFDIGVIDTEYKRTAQYQGKVHFTDQEMDFLLNDIYDGDYPDSVDGIHVVNQFSPLVLIHKIREASKMKNIRLLGIDSLSLAWNQILERKTEIEVGGQKRYANSFSAWGHPETKPLWSKMMSSIMSFNGAVVCTIRSKMKHELMKVGDKSQVVKVGLDAIAQPESEYESTIILENNSAEAGMFEVTKDNSGMGLSGKQIENPDEKFGYSIMEYLFSENNGKSLYVPKYYMDKETQDIMNKIINNEQKIRDNAQLLSAFETHVSIDLYKNYTDKETLSKAWKAVQNMAKKIKANRRNE